MSNGTRPVWRSEKREIRELIPAAYNPREMNEKENDDLRTSLDSFGLVDEIVVNADNTIIGGHQRVRILKGEGVTEVDVRCPDRLLDKDEEVELNLRLNKNRGRFNFDELVNLDESILKAVGFDSKELDRIFQIETDDDENEVAQERQPTDIKTGDLFELGEHKLLCGDSVKAEDVAVLMGGEKSRMIHTDPPYNVDYGASKKQKIREIQNDSMPTDEWKVFCHKIYDIFREYNTGDIYMWGASAPEGMRMRLWLVETGCHWSATIIWKKQQLVLSPANYQRMYEPCFYGWYDKSSYNKERDQVEVWEINRPRDSKLHPTMKPIELCEKAIRNSSERGDIVLDLFGGSGSTLIACEKSNRKCRMIEIDPVYCQVIIDRWEKHTGLKAVKVN